jgi:hypothetical protein
VVENSGWLFVNRPATLVFRTVHYDKAGETSDYRVVKAEIADVDAAGMAILVTRSGIHVRFPARMLFPVHAADTPPEGQKFIGGQELVRDFHPREGAARTAIRWLNRAEVEPLIAPRPKAKRRVAPKRRKSK